MSEKKEPGCTGPFSNAYDCPVHNPNKHENTTPHVVAPTPPPAGDATLREEDMTSADAAAERDAWRVLGERLGLLPAAPERAQPAAPGSASARDTWQQIQRAEAESIARLNVQPAAALDAERRAPNPLHAATEEAKRKLSVLLRDGGPSQLTGDDLLRSRAPALRDALERTVLALTDWMHCYAAEECDVDDVARSRSRVENQGGTLAYIADVLKEARAALEGL